MDKNIPLSILMENARGRLIQAFNGVVEETKLPAYLYEGMILEILSEVRNRKNIELLSDMKTANSKENGRSEEKEE